MKQVAGWLLLIAGILSPRMPVAQSFYEALDSVAEANHLIGMSVAVVCQHELCDRYHWGMADLARDIRVTDSTMYRVASISKSVTATALMQLYDKGLFSLDDPVSPDLGFDLINPHFPSEPITYRMLLSHTSGLNDGTGYSYFLTATYNQNPAPVISQLLVPGGTFYTADMWLNKAPGTYFTYANINFGVIATLIERLSGIRFDVIVRDSLLLPLGIEGSFNVCDIGTINNVAVLYRNSVPQMDDYQGIPPSPQANWQSYVVGTNGLLFSPQGGLRISALDLVRFMIMHQQEGIYDSVRILADTTVQRMHAIQWDFNGTNGNNYYNLFRRWGLGFHLTTNTPNGDIVIPDAAMTGHPGEAYGLISDLYFEEERGFGLVFMTNGYSGTAGYQYGNYSAYYLPEEGVFTAIDTWHYDQCFPLGIDAGILASGESIPVTLWNSENQLMIANPGRLEGTIEVYATTGRCILICRLEQVMRQTIPHAWHPGIFFVRIRSGSRCDTYRLFVL